MTAQTWTKRLRLLMAQSADGYACRGPDDDMRWTGPVDKAVFRLLTLTEAGERGAQLVMGPATFRSLPPFADSRRTVVVSRAPSAWMPLARELPNAIASSLEIVADMFPGAWLIGGPRLADAALRAGIISQAVICTVPETLDKLVRRLGADPDAERSAWVRAPWRTGNCFTESEWDTKFVTFPGDVTCDVLTRKATP